MATVGFVRIWGWLAHIATSQISVFAILSQNTLKKKSTPGE
jgi:hypothetical protein